MKNSKTTKRAVLNSGMSLVVCSAMLIGTTFAWFTDEATTGINKIQAGNLDVGIMMKNNKNNWVSAEGKTLNFIVSDQGQPAKDEDGNILWEPGARFDIPALKIENNGNLALKFKLIVNGVTGDVDLAEVIDVYSTTTDNGEKITEKIGTLRELMNDPDGAAHGNLKKGKSTGEYKLSFEMQKSAGKDYANKSISDISFTVLATQDTVEYDSYSNQYDANIKLTLDEVKEALKAGENLTLVKDLTVTSDEFESNGYGKTGINHTNGGLIDGNGNTLTVEDAKDTWDSVINTKGGTIKNLKVKGAFRGIFTGGLTSDLTIENVIFEDVTYTFSADGSGDYNVILKNSTLNGWTSYTSGFKSVSFINCNFGKGNGYAFMRPYNPTTLTNCEFEKGFKLDATQTSDIVLENCTVNGEEITQDNIKTLLGANAVKAQVK